MVMCVTVDYVVNVGLRWLILMQWIFSRWIYIIWFLSNTLPREYESTYPRLKSFKYHDFCIDYSVYNFICPIFSFLIPDSWSQIQLYGPPCCLLSVTRIDRYIIYVSFSYCCIEYRYIHIFYMYICITVLF